MHKTWNTSQIRNSSDLFHKSYVRSETVHLSLILMKNVKYCGHSSEKVEILFEKSRCSKVNLIFPMNVRFPKNVEGTVTTVLS